MPPKAQLRLPHGQSKRKSLGTRRLSRNFRAKYESEPNLFSALAYTSVYLLSHAISNAGSIESDAIRDALAETENFDTVLGSFSFDAVGDPVYDPIMLIVQDGEFETFE